MKIANRAGTAAFVVVLSTLAVAAHAQQLIYTSSQDSGIIGRVTNTGTALSPLASGGNYGGGITRDASGNVLFVESNSNFSVTNIRRVTPGGVDLGNFASNTGFFGKMTFAANGQLYAQRFDQSASLRGIHRFGADGSDQGYFITGNNLPLIADGFGGQTRGYVDSFMFASDNSVYVAYDNNAGTTNTGAIRHFSAAGADLGDFATGINTPDGIALDSVGNVYVSQFRSGNVVRYSPGGTPLGVFATTGGQPDSLGFDQSGNLFVSGLGYGSSGIREYSPNGTFVQSVTGTGSSVRNFTFGSAVVAVPEADTLALLLPALSLAGASAVRRARKPA